MNIFYLDNDPTTAARYHCNKHVVKMILESAQEYKHRFNHSVDHKSFRMLENNAIRGYLAYYVPDGLHTPPAQAMPEYLKSDDAVFSYRLYYQLEKADLLQYTNRERPDWL